MAPRGAPGSTSRGTSSSRSATSGSDRGGELDRAQLDARAPESRELAGGGAPRVALDPDEGHPPGGATGDRDQLARGDQRPRQPALPGITGGARGVEEPSPPSLETLEELGRRSGGVAPPDVRRERDYGELLALALRGPRLLGQGPSHPEQPLGTGAASAGGGVHEADPEGGQPDVLLARRAREEEPGGAEQDQDGEDSAGGGDPPGPLGMSGHGRPVYPVAPSSSTVEPVSPERPAGKAREIQPPPRSAIPAVERRSLPRRDGELGLVEDDAGAAAVGLDRRRCGAVVIAHLDLGPEALARRGIEPDPVELLDLEGVARALGLRAEHDGPGLRVGLEDVEGLPCRDAEAATLADREVLGARVVSEHPAGRVDQRPGVQLHSALIEDGGGSRCRGRSRSPDCRASPRCASPTFPARARTSCFSSAPSGSSVRARFSSATQKS